MKDQPKTSQRVADLLLAPLGLQTSSLTVLQTLWAGYGQVCAITAISSSDEARSQNLILKLIEPPDNGSDESHLRKLLSYEVEQSFYEEVCPHLDPKTTPVAKCLATLGPTHHGDTMAMVVTDLRTDYPVAGGKRSPLTEPQAISALNWLARFHAQTCQLVPRPFDTDRFVYPPLEEARRQEKSHRRARLWLYGGYTYLATRRSELSVLAQDIESEWSSAFCRGLPSMADKAARVLTPRGRAQECYLHGDVKSENLFSTLEGDQVAFFDFQYVGLGLGVCDLAKLFTCSVPLYLLTKFTVDDMPNQLPMDDGERRLLQNYLDKLCDGSTKIIYDWALLVRHWETALVDWCRFQASWGFWGNTLWLQARVRSVLADKYWADWLQSELEKTA